MKTLCRVMGLALVVCALSGCATPFTQAEQDMFSRVERERGVRSSLLCARILQRVKACEKDQGAAAATRLLADLSARYPYESRQVAGFLSRPTHVPADADAAGALSPQSVSPVALATAPIGDTGTPKAIPQSMPVSQRWALVIGITKYRDTRVPALRYAAADARAFSRWLESAEGGGYNPAQVKLLCDEQATAENIRDAFFNWLKQPIEEDLVTIFYAGHGSAESPDSQDNLFLLPYDVDYSRIATTAFPMWDIETALKRFIKAKRVVVIADACHAAGVGQQFDIARRAGRGMKVNPIANGFNGLSSIGSSVCILSAADASQFSQEGDKWGGGHGVFTYFLLRGLEGQADSSRDGRVTVLELASYVSEQVRRATGSAQCPRMAGSFDPALAIGR